MGPLHHSKFRVYVGVRTCDICFFLLVACARVCLLFSGLLALLFSFRFVIRKFEFG